MDTGHNSFYSDLHRAKDAEDVDLYEEQEMPKIKRNVQKKVVKIQWQRPSQEERIKMGTQDTLMPKQQFKEQRQAKH